MKSIEKGVKEILNQIEVDGNARKTRGRVDRLYDWYQYMMKWEHECDIAECALIAARRLRIRVESNASSLVVFGSISAGSVKKSARSEWITSFSSASLLGNDRIKLRSFFKCAGGMTKLARSSPAQFEAAFKKATGLSRLAYCSKYAPPDFG